jgi:hypothetical protein
MRSSRRFDAALPCGAAGLLGSYRFAFARQRNDRIDLVAIEGPINEFGVLLRSIAINGEQVPMKDRSRIIFRQRSA